MDDLIKECHDFVHDKIWMTKKCRILAEERHKIIEVALKVAIVVWTTVGLIIVLMGDASNAYYSAIVTGTIFGISSLSFSINFTVRSSNYKQSYIALSRLEEKAKLFLKTCEMNKDSDALEKFKNFEVYKNEYFDILEKSDNHSNFDYERVVIKTGKKNEIKKALFFSKLVLFNVVLIAIIIIPIFLLVVLWKS